MDNALVEKEIQNKLDLIAAETLVELKQKEKERHLGLLSGSSGQILFLSLYSASNNKIYDKFISQFLEEAVDLINKQKGFKTTTYCDGIQGFGWLLNFLKNKKIIEGEINVDIIDYIAYKKGLSDLKLNNYDFLHGAVGNLFYLTTSDSKNNYTSELFFNYYSKKSITENGIYWDDN
jgi:hypothetical protein